MTSEPTPPPTRRELLDWLDGRLTPERASVVSSYAESAGPDVQELIDWHREFLRVAKVMPLQAPPPEVSRRLRELFDSTRAPAAGEGVVGLHLEFDSRTQPAMVGVRSGGDDQTFHLTYTGSGVTLKLDVSRLPSDELLMMGSLASTLDKVSLARVPLTVLAGRGIRHTTSTDAAGQFQVRALPDVDELRMRLATHVVSVAIELGQDT